MGGRAVTRIMAQSLDGSLALGSVSGGLRILNANSALPVTGLIANMSFRERRIEFKIILNLAKVAARRG